MKKHIDIAVVGGGAAGYFGALAAAKRSPSSQITILEAGSTTLSKVLISGGGRCNVTHHCYDINKFLEYYPRGARELRSVFSRFQAEDTVAWFAARGVELKAEADRRMFPTTDSSQTIVDCLERTAQEAGITIQRKTKVKTIEKHSDGFSLHCKNNLPIIAKYVLLASGGSRAGFEFAESLGHSIVPAVPSLFTFNVKDPRIEGLAGISVPQALLTLAVDGSKPFRASGPLLVTHWGLSGPAVLKLSAWAARELSATDYQAVLSVNWLGSKEEQVFSDCVHLKEASPKKSLSNLAPDGISKRLWQQLLEFAEISGDSLWGELANKKLRRLAQELTAGKFEILGKGVFKEEFVTAGGVKLSEVDFRSMQSKITPGLYFAGEILDIDGLTGGFNFQSAWSTSHLAGRSMASGLT